MNFEQRLGEGAPGISGSKGKRPDLATGGVSKDKSFKTSEDENFPGSTIMKTKDAEGKIKVYALRMGDNSEIEGNEISYLPDKSVGGVQRLSDEDIERLRNEGILDKFEQIKKVEKEEKVSNAIIWLRRLYSQGKNPYMTQQRSDLNEQMYIDETAKALEGFSDAEQASLAETLFREQGRSEKLQYVMYHLRDTRFGDKLKELEEKARKTV